MLDAVNFMPVASKSHPNDFYFHDVCVPQFSPALEPTLWFGLQIWGLAMWIVFYVAMMGSLRAMGPAPDLMQVEEADEDRGEM
jgi:hypothetical protein